MHLTAVSSWSAASIESLASGLFSRAPAAAVGGAAAPFGPLALAAVVGLGVGLALGFALARSRRATLEERLRFLEEHRSRAESLDEQNRELGAALAEARARLEAEGERGRWQAQAEERLRASFESLALGVVREGGEELTQRSRESFERTVEPLRQTLAALDTQVRELERDRQGAYEGLRRELLLLRDAQRQLHGTTRDLSQALKTSSGSRGRWGEVQLRRLVEMAGLVPHVDFIEQPVVGNQRPDMVVHLPAGGVLPIDAKTPLSDYLAAAEAPEEEDRAARLDAHLRAFKKRAAELSAKAYWQAFERSPDFVIMFLPHDGMLAAAFERDPHLLEFCMARKVLPATPVTLLALLRTVAWGWQRQHVAEGAQRIAKAGREVHERLARMTGHLQRMGQGLEGAVDAYNKAVGSMERRLMPAARRLEEAAALEDGAEAPAQITTAPRSPSSEG